MVGYRTLPNRKRLLSKGKFENYKKCPTILSKEFKKKCSSFSRVKFCLKMKALCIIRFTNKMVRSSKVFTPWAYGGGRLTATRDPQLHWPLLRLRYLSTVRNAKNSRCPNAKIFVILAIVYSSIFLQILLDLQFYVYTYASSYTRFPWCSSFV